MAAQSAETLDRQWFVVNRWQQFAGEGRANLLRVIAVGAFYVVHSYDYYFRQAAADRDADFHQAATALAVAWAVAALAVSCALARRWMPEGLKFAITAVDVVLLTSLVVLARGGQSPLVFAYFLIIASSALRFDLLLIRAATIACLAGYLVALGVRDPDWFGNPNRAIEVPRIEQLLVLLSLALTGIIIGQIVRRARALADEYARRLRPTTSTPESPSTEP